MHTQTKSASLPLSLLAAGLALAALAGCTPHLQIDGRISPLKATVNANRAHDTVQKQLVADKVRLLDIDAGMGDVTVRAADNNANVILIRATKYVTGDRPMKELETYLPKVPITTALKGDTLVLRSKDDGLGLQMKTHGMRFYVSYVITMPKRLALELNTSSGDIKVENVEGGVRAETGSGPISVQTAAGSLNLKTASGNVMLHDAPQADEVIVSTSSGNIDMKNIAGRCDAHTASGDFTLDGARIDGRLSLESSSGQLKCSNVRSASSALDLKLTTVSGDIAYHGDASQIDVRSSSGNVEIFTPPDLPLTAVKAESISGNLNLTLPGLNSAQIDAHSVSGSLSLPMGHGNTAGNGNDATQHNVSVVLGNGTTHIVLNSSSGDITVSDRVQRQ